MWHKSSLQLFRVALRQIIFRFLHLLLLLQAASMRVWGRMSLCVVPSWEEGINAGPQMSSPGCVPWLMSKKSGQMEAGFCFLFLLILAGDLGSWDQCVFDFSLCKLSPSGTALGITLQKEKEKNKIVKLRCLLLWKGICTLLSDFFIIYTACNEKWRLWNVCSPFKEDTGSSSLTQRQEN